jgi:hypothetical protein
MTPAITRWFTNAALTALALAACAGPACGDEGAKEGGPFSGTLEAPRVGAATFEQDPPLPETCDLPPKDGPFKALGRNPGPAAVAHHSGGRAIDSAALAGATVTALPLERTRYPGVYRRGQRVSSCRRAVVHEATSARGEMTA